MRLSHTIVIHATKFFTLESHLTPITKNIWKVCSYVISAEKHLTTREVYLIMSKSTRALSLSVM